MSKSYFNRPALEAIHKQCLDLGQRKNHDYGAAGDAIAETGVRGVVVRMNDKQKRLLSLTQEGHVAAVKDESIRDTFMDMINYATYAISLMDGTWGRELDPSVDDIVTGEDAAAALRGGRSPKLRASRKKRTAWNKGLSKAEMAKVVSKRRISRKRKAKKARRK